MKQEDYRICMAKGLKGKTGLSKEERLTLFCTTSKICSGKSKTLEEAKLICSQPKEPKPLKARKSRGGGQSCEKEVHKVAECVVSRLVENDVYRDQALNINSVGAALTNALIECSCSHGKND